MILDPLYLILMGIGTVLSLGASAWTRSAFASWSNVRTRRGLTGAQVAEAILRGEGIKGVRIERVNGMLSDHYDPRGRVLRLSDGVYGSTSVSAAGVAAHEVGHALQHANGSVLMSFRQTLVPVANIGTNLGVWIMLIGLMIGAGGLAKIGIVLFAGFVIFTLITLPIELDASWKAGRALTKHQILERDELAGVRTVLTAAATTYLAAAIAALLQLFYWALRLGLIGNRRD